MLRLLDEAAGALVPTLTREDILERIDPDTLRSAPLNLLTSTAVAIAPPDVPEAAEDAVLRYIEGLDSERRALATHARLTAEALVLAFVEYQSAITAYATAEREHPVRDDWKNPQHYLDACKVHERRMDRLLRSRKETFDRYEKASEVYRKAILTREGHEILLEVSQARKTPPRAVQATVSSPDTPQTVEVLPPATGGPQAAAIETSSGSKVFIVVQ